MCMYTHIIIVCKYVWVHVHTHTCTCIFITLRACTRGRVVTHVHVSCAHACFRKLLCDVVRIKVESEERINRITRGSGDEIIGVNQDQYVHVELMYVCSILFSSLLSM